MYFKKKVDPRKSSFYIQLWEFRFPELLVFEIRPHFIYKVKLVDSDIEREIQYIKDILWGVDDLYGKYAKDKPSAMKDPNRKENSLLKALDNDLEEHYYDYITNN